MPLTETLLKQLIIDTGDYFQIADEYVEKDYWLTKILKNIFSKEIDYVFKGGTSLSKCFHLINRFSEDIDISYSISYASIGSSQRNKKFKGITSSVKESGLDISNKERLLRSAYFNQLICPYNSVLTNSGVLIDKHVVIELAAQTPSFPHVRKSIQSFIGEYLDKIGRHDLVEEYELQAFEINVQSLERTFIDKTFAICDYYLANRCKKHSRHLYDLSKIITQISLDSSLADLFNQVREYRKEIEVCYSAKEDQKLAKILAEIIENDSFKEDYEKITRPLLYEQITYDSCRNALVEIRDFLTNFDL